MLRSYWPTAGGVVYDVLIGSADEVHPDLEGRPPWMWRWVWRSTAELVDKAATAGPSPMVELWRIEWCYPFGIGGDRVAWVTEAELLFPSVLDPEGHPVLFYRLRSHVDLGTARRDFEVLARTIRQALRPLS